MNRDNYNQLVNKSHEISIKWRSLPAPQRGEYIRKFGEELRKQKVNLAALITEEARKIKTESMGKSKRQLICVTLLLA